MKTARLQGLRRADEFAARFFCTLFARNRKFTFYPLRFHKEALCYYQSKDKD